MSKLPPLYNHAQRFKQSLPLRPAQSRQVFFNEHVSLRCMALRDEARVCQRNDGPKEAVVGIEPG